MPLTEAEKQGMSERLAQQRAEHAKLQEAYERKRADDRAASCCAALADAMELSNVFDGEIRGIIELVDDSTEPERRDLVRFCPFCGKQRVP